MSIIRISKRENPFVQIDKRPLQDETLSWKAKGILAYLLSKPDHWQVSVLDLKARSKDGIGSVRAGLKELKSAGYAKLEVVQGEDGRMAGTTWVIFEEPHRDTKNPDVGINRISEKPKLGELDPSNKDIISNNEKGSKKEILDFSKFDNPLEAEKIWVDWVTYRKAKRIPAYAKGYEQRGLNLLLTLSEGNSVSAKSIVDRSISNSYRGLFELPKKDIKPPKEVYVHPKRTENNSLPIIGEMAKKLSANV